MIDTSYKIPFFGNHFVVKALLENLVNLLTKFVPGIHKKGHANFLKFKNTSDFDVKRLLSDILHTSLRSWLLISKNLISFDAQSLLEMIIVPSLIVCGTADSIFPPSVAINLKNRIKRSTLNLIPEANHILVLNNPKELEQSIYLFLKAIKYL